MVVGDGLRGPDTEDLVLEVGNDQHLDVASSDDEGLAIEAGRFG